MGLHDGHRQRTKEEFLAHGLDAFSELRTLELLLFYTRPQGDVVPTAKALLAAFGSLSGVLSASQEELEKVSGVGQHTVVLLRLVSDLTGGQPDHPLPQTVVPADLPGPQVLPDLFIPRLRPCRNERCALACFDGNANLLSLYTLGEGGLASARVNTRTLISLALECDSHLIALAHNHPSGKPLPSQEDISTTRYLFQYLKGAEIYLADHVIVGKDDAISMRQSGYFDTF